MAGRPKPRKLDPLLDRMMALADPSRWNIIHLLSKRSRTVSALATATGLSVAVTSRHIQRLRAAGLVIGEKRGKELHCSRPDRETPMGRWLDATLEETSWTPNVPPVRVRYKQPSTAGESKPPASEGHVPPYAELEDYLL